MAPFSVVIYKEKPDAMLMKILRLFLSATVVLASLAANADSDKDERGHGRWHGRGHDKGEYKEEYWDGNCKVKRKYEKHGEYKEERKCKGARHDYYEPVPGYVPVYPVPHQNSGVTINGTVRIP